MAASDHDTKTGGGRLSQRIQSGERLRPATRSTQEHSERLMSGEAWRDFCRALERAGEFVLEADNPTTERTRAEGYRYLMGMTTLAIRQSLELADPERPYFTRIQDPWAKWGAENADNHYLQAEVRGDRSYRIRGERGSCLNFLVEVKEGFMHFGDVRNFATLSAKDLQIDDDGRFEIIASVAEQPGNWLPLHPDATQILIRQYFYDWDREEPARFTIECIESNGQPPEPLTSEAMSRVVESAGHFVEMTTRFWGEWMPQMRQEHVPGRLQPARPFVGGADDIRYGNDVYALGPDEALVIETEIPDATFWHYQLCNDWFVTMDYRNRIISLNGAQVHVDPDGRVRIVIAHRDPGVPNWLDTGGEPTGMIQYRYVWTRDSPEPKVSVVAFDDIQAHLPAATPRIDPETRQQQLAARQAAVARRFRN